MSKQINIEFEVREIKSYPDPTVGSKRFLIIEYKVTKEEINRYYVGLKEEHKNE